jgi:hypothetical protein
MLSKQRVGDQNQVLAAIEQGLSERRRNPGPLYILLSPMKSSAMSLHRSACDSRALDS